MVRPPARSNGRGVRSAAAGRGSAGALDVLRTPQPLRRLAVKKLFKFAFILAFVFGGWALAAASLHVVRASGSMIYGKVPFTLMLVPKNTLGFTDTYVDTTKWNADDLAAHPAQVDRLRQANNQH